MTPTSKWMRFVSVSTPNRDFTKYGPTEGNLAKARAASVELGGRSGLEYVRSSNIPSLTIASCQHRNVANSRCCWVLTAPGLLLTPLPRRRTPDIPARGPLAESRRREPIRCQSGSGTKSSYPRASRPYGVNHQYPTNAKSQTRTSGTDAGCGKRSARRMSPAQRMNF